MTEEQRMVFENDSKMIALSSASYTFENLYKTYKEWTDKINSNEPQINLKLLSEPLSKLFSN